MQWRERPGVRARPRPTSSRGRPSCQRGGARAGGRRPRPPVSRSRRGTTLVYPVWELFLKVRKHWLRTQFVLADRFRDKRMKKMIIVFPRKQLMRKWSISTHLSQNTAFSINLRQLGCYHRDCPWDFHVSYTKLTCSVRVRVSSLYRWNSKSIICQNYLSHSLSQYFGKRIQIIKSHLT